MREKELNLKYVIGIKSEIEDLEQKYNSFVFKIFETEDELKNEVQDKGDLYKEALLIAATDNVISLGKQFEIATMAYANPKFRHQSYSGVDMIVEGFEEVDADFLEKVYQRHHRIPWTILESERCVVKELSLEDLDAVFALYKDGEIDKYTDSLYPYEEEKEFQRAYIENMYRYFGYGLWLVFSKETGNLVGRAGLEHREYHEEIELELGYIIGKQYQGQGYATEVCKSIISYAKENTSFERINALIEDGNAASLGVAKKLGFVHEEDFELNDKVMHRYILDFTTL